MGFDELDIVFFGSAPCVSAYVAETFLLQYGGMYLAMVGTVYDGLAVGEELQLFGNLLTAGEEVLVMRLSYVGKDADGGVDNTAQAFHFAHFGDARLEYGKLVVVRHLPYRQRHADLGVVAAWIGNNGATAMQQLHYPVLDNGLAIAARDTDHRNMVLAPMPSGELLQRQHDIFDEPEIGTMAQAELLLVFLGRIDGHHKVATTPLVHVVDIAAACIPLGRDGKEECLTHIGESAAVGKEVCHLAVGIIDTGVGTC